MPRTANLLGAVALTLADELQAAAAAVAGHGASGPAALQSKTNPRLEG